MPHSNAKSSATAPLIAFESLRQPVWTPRDYHALAREGFAQNAIVYRCVRMIAEAAASVPLLLSDGDEEIEDHLLMRIDSMTEDALIASLIVTSRLHIEAALGLALLTQAWSYFADAWPRNREIALPLKPVQAVTAVRVWAQDGTSQTVSANTYTLDGEGTPPRLVLSRSAAPPAPGRSASGIEIAFDAGYGDAGIDVPAPIRQALLLLVAHWFENREPHRFDMSETEIPHMVSALLAPYRGRRL